MQRCGHPDRREEERRRIGEKKRRFVSSRIR